MNLVHGQDIIPCTGLLDEVAHGHAMAGTAL